MILFGYCILFKYHSDASIKFREWTYFFFSHQVYAVILSILLICYCEELLASGIIYYFNAHNSDKLLCIYYRWHINIQFLWQCTPITISIQTASLPTITSQSSPQTSFLPTPPPASPFQLVAPQATTLSTYQLPIQCPFCQAFSPLLTNHSFIPLLCPVIALSIYTNPNRFLHESTSLQPITSPYTVPSSNNLLTHWPPYSPGDLFPHTINRSLLPPTTTSLPTWATSD